MTLANRVWRELSRRKRTSLALSLVARKSGLENLGIRLSRNADVRAPVIPVVVPCGGRPRPFVMEACDGRDQVARAIWNDGWHGFERPLPDLLTRVAPLVSGTFIDVGANTGFYSLVAARANPRLEIYAFEPFPPVFDIFRRNLALNGSPPQIHAVQAALGGANGTADLYVPLQDHGLVETSCSLDATFKSAHSEVVQVPVVTLDDFVARQGIRGIPLLKIDVEGHEHAVLRGAVETVRRERPIIVYELLAHGEADSLEAFRVEHGYDSYQLRDATGLVLPEPRVTMDRAAWNHVMVPRERVEFAEAVFESLPLPLAG